MIFVNDSYCFGVSFKNRSASGMPLQHRRALSEEMRQIETMQEFFGLKILHFQFGLQIGPTVFLSPSLRPPFEPLSPPLNVSVQLQVAPS